MWRTPATKKHPRQALPPHANRRVRARADLLTKRRRVRIGIFGIGALVLSVLIYGASTLSYLPSLRVNEIDIAGARVYDAMEIEHVVRNYTAGAYWYVLSKDNVALYPRASLEELLLYTFPRIKTIDISRTGTHDVAIDIEERAPYAYWCTMPAPDAEQVCWHIDAEGLIYEQVATTTPSVIRFTGGVSEDEPLRTNIAPEYFAQIARIAEGIQNETDLHIDTISFLGDETHMQIEPGWTLKLVASEAADNLLSKFKAILDTNGLRANIEDIEYIDMRFGERVYYKLRS